MLWCAMHDTYAEALPPFSEREFRHLAAAALSKTAPVADPDAPDTPSDFDLSPELVAEIARAPLALAAVLIPVVARPELTVLLTQRTDALPRHPGQIAFPGGRMDPTDADPIATALREAQEEIGLDPRFVDHSATSTPTAPAPAFASSPSSALCAKASRCSSMRARWPMPSKCRSHF